MKSIRFNEHLDEEDGPLVFEHACKLGVGRHRFEAHRFALSFGSIARLDQEQESTGACGEAGG